MFQHQKRRLHRDSQADLFFHFPRDARDNGFPRPDFPAGKLPQPAQRRLGFAPSEKDPIAFAHDSQSDVYGGVSAAGVHTVSS
jgi:hypothetical protein